jgi:hypothetical protein
MRAGAVVSAILLALAASAVAATVQQNNLRITALAQVKPHRLPRVGTAPIAVFVSGHIRTADKSLPPQLEAMTIRINKHGRLDDSGLPACPLEKISSATTGRALRECPEALVGSGRFWASIILPDQRPYATRGRLLVFNGRLRGRPAIFAHIYTTNPFATSFVIPFTIKHIDDRVYGTELHASLPEALGTWGYVDRIKLTLQKMYRYRGRQHSYFNAGCPAPVGTDVTAFRLAEADFSFAGGEEVGLTVTKSCAVKE